MKECHTPVLKEKVIEYLNPRPNENYVDCTFGLGGHALSILEKNGPEGKVVGIEMDSDLYKELKKKEFSKRLILVNDSYVNLKEIVEESGIDSVSGILFDLGMSSWHLEESGKGFSFKKNEKLDMRYNRSFSISAEEIVNESKEEEIKNILEKFGEERFSKRIARRIVEEREKGKIETTFQLVEIIKKAIPGRYAGRGNFATRSFQALRIASNDELRNIEKGLEQSLDVVERGGIIVVISFHSLEDRIVKHFFKKRPDSVEILTKKPVIPEEGEIETNTRSRSAKLRVAKKI